MKLRLSDVSVSFGDNTVLSHINFEVNGNDKVAIVGRNGCGKTTLLNVIMGYQEIDEANENQHIEKTGNFKIGHQKQIAFDDDFCSLNDEILKVYKPITDLKAKIEETEKQFETSTDPTIFDKYTRLCEEFDSLGGYTYQKEMNLSLKQFGFTEQDKTKKISEFSGGQQTKIALIKLLLSKPDLLILDEPTNHLDINAISWLENYLKEYKKAVIVVSHDRAFLDNFVNVVYEIERHKIKRYVGNYSDFVKQKKLQYEKQQKDFTAYTEEVNRLQTLVDRFRYKATKASMAQSKLKQIDRMEKVENPEKFDMKAFSADITPQRESGNEVLNVKDLKIGYDKVLSSVNFKLYKGERVGIIGDNGLGKSTFLKTLVGKTEALGGKAVFGINVDVGYFDQKTAASNISDESILDNYLKRFPDLSTNQARSDLGAFMFSQDDVFKNLQDLSGGELVRLELCKIFKTKPNLLILDEPTNHLDIVGKEALEELLLKYNGTILFVSHDRYFVNKLATSLLVFENGTATYYKNTTYNEYVKLKEKQAEEQNLSQVLLKETQKPKQTETSPTASMQVYSKGKEENRRKARVRKLESDISKIEQEIKELTDLYNSPEVFSDYQKMQELDSQIKEKNKVLENLTEQWYKENI